MVGGESKFSWDVEISWQGGVEQRGWGIEVGHWDKGDQGSVEIL